MWRVWLADGMVLAREEEEVEEEEVEEEEGEEEEGVEEVSSKEKPWNQQSEYS